MSTETVSNSRLNLFDRCHYAHFLKYGMKIDKRKKASPLVRGVMFHSILEEFNNGKSWKKKWELENKAFKDKFFKDEIIEMGDIPGMVYDLMLSYQEHYEGEELEYIWSEAEFDVPLTTGINLLGYIDSLTKDETGLWPMDHKTYAKMPDRDGLILDPQSNRYMWALQQLGYVPSGFIWNIIKAKRPSRPKLTTKKQELSTAAIDSTPTIMRLGIKELGLNPDDYQEVIDKTSFDSFFYRKKIRYNPTIMKSVIEDTIVKAQWAVNDLDSFKDKSMGRNCSWCSYKSICYAELMGSDVDYIIKKEYAPRKKDNNDKAKTNLKNPKPDKDQKRTSRRSSRS